jgi:hypothetical protein
VSRARHVDVLPTTSDSHQVTPSWVVTVLRWNDRTSGPAFGGALGPKKAVRRPLVIESDAISVSVQNGKDSVTPGCTVVLKGGDLNYSTAIAPGDFVFVNILNDEKRAADVAERARGLKPINGLKDGFKGMYKVKGCRRQIMTQPNGAKTLSYNLSAFAFTELNNVIYFNPYLFNRGESDSIAFITNIGGQWNQLVNNKSIIDNQDIIIMLIQLFIGRGFSETAREVKGLLRNFNSHYLVPDGVRRLLGVRKAEKVADVTNVIIGVESYSSGGPGAPLNEIFAPGVRSFDPDKDGRFYQTGDKIQGRTLVRPEYWAQVKAWSILEQYLNPPMNEAFTGFRVAPDSQKVMPTITVRQIPFTKEKIKPGIPVTRFLSMPRWRIDPGLILGADLGRDEAARVNFVQMFGRSTLINEQFNTSSQIAAGNYIFDVEDVRRNGLRPYIRSSNSDWPEGAASEDIKGSLVPQWKDIIADAVFDGHLRESGSLQTAGIEDPIDVGMNLQLGSVVYHIEGISHRAGINGEGNRFFQTVFSLSHGLDERTNASRPVYPEMVHTDYLTYQEEDFEHEQLLPGVTDVQDTGGRDQGERARPRLNQTPFNPGVGKRRKR